MAITCGARCRDGSPCDNSPMRGGERCRMHGGASPRARAAAERRQVEGQARSLLAELGVIPVADPLAQLLQLAGEVLAWQKATSELVNQLDHIRYQGGSGEQLRAEVALYERAMDRAVSVLAAVARLNIDERLAAVSEKQAEAVIGAIEAGLAAVGVTGDQVLTAKRAAARHLRLVEEVAP
ncbi:HGGxSTG domain-containing protein [Streptomyces sp. NPDC003483]